MKLLWPFKGIHRHGRCIQLAEELAEAGMSEGGTPPNRRHDPYAPDQLPKGVSRKITGQGDTVTIMSTSPST